MRTPVLLMGLAMVLGGCDWTTVDEKSNPLDQTTWSATFVVHNDLFSADEQWSTVVNLYELDDDLSGTAEWVFQWLDPDPWLDGDPVYGLSEFVEGQRYAGDSLRFALYTAPASEDFDCDLLDRASACTSLRPAALYFFGAVTSDSTMSGYGVTYTGTTYARVDDLVFWRAD